MTFDDRIRATIAARNQPKLRPVNDALGAKYTLHDADGNCVSRYLDTGKPAEYAPWELQPNDDPRWHGYQGVLRHFLKVLNVEAFPRVIGSESE